MSDFFTEAPESRRECEIDTTKRRALFLRTAAFLSQLSLEGPSSANAEATMCPFHRSKHESVLRWLFAAVTMGLVALCVAFQVAFVRYLDNRFALVSRQQSNFGVKYYIEKQSIYQAVHVKYNHGHSEKGGCMLLRLSCQAQ